MRLVGSEQYKNLFKALDYYKLAGYTYIDVPWAVSEEAVNITRPAWAVGDACKYSAGGNALFPVASAEQSFLQMKLDDPKFSGKLMTMTPCFRNEPVLDELHQPYFMKVELINWDKTGREDMDKMIADARMLFEEFLWVDAVHNTDPDPLGVVAYDLYASLSNIELGSYGIREHPKIGRWLYGTGLAEPRYSYALEREAVESKKLEHGYSFPL